VLTGEVCSGQQASELSIQWNTLKLVLPPVLFECSNVFVNVVGAVVDEEKAFIVNKYHLRANVYDTLMDVKNVMVLELSQTWACGGDFATPENLSLCSVCCSLRLNSCSTSLNLQNLQAKSGVSN